MSPSPPAGPPPQRPKGGGGCRSGQQEAPKPKERGNRGKSPLLLWSCSFPGGEGAFAPQRSPASPGSGCGRREGAVGHVRHQPPVPSPVRARPRQPAGRAGFGTAQVPRLFAQVLKRISPGGLREAGALARGGSIPPSRTRGPSQNPQNN